MRHRILLSESAGDKFRKHIFLMQHGKRHLKKLRQRDKIDADILILCPADGMTHLLVQHQHIPLVKCQFLPPDDVRDAPLHDIHDLHIVVPVLREIHKAAVRAHGDEPSPL